MGSSSEIRKHKKSSKKHKKHSRSKSHSPDEIVDSRHSHHRCSKHSKDKHYVDPDMTVVESRSRSLEKERRHKHKHKKHKDRKHHHHHREGISRHEENGQSLKHPEIISIVVENSDSDSSDCVEVPVDVPPPPNISKQSSLNRDFIQIPVSRRVVSKVQDKTLEVLKSGSARRSERDEENAKRRDYDRAAEVHDKTMETSKSSISGRRSEREGEYVRRRDYSRAVEVQDKTVETLKPSIPARRSERDGDYERRRDYDRAAEVQDKTVEPLKSARRSERSGEYEKRRDYERTAECDSEYTKRKDYDRADERSCEYDKRRDYARASEREIEYEKRRDYERNAEREKESERDYREREREWPDREHLDRTRERDHDRHRTHRSTEQPEKRRRVDRSPSPIPEGGAGDSLSIEETNKLRLKLGLKPLELDSGTAKSASSIDISRREPADKNLASYSDEWGDFLHKPADNIKVKVQAEKMREKLSQKKEKRILEDRLKTVRTLGESDDEVDDILKWVNRNKEIVDQKKEAERRAKALEEMDAEFGVDELIEKEKRTIRRNAYNDRELRGLRVDHDVEDFTEGKTVILTLKDKGVLDEGDDGDTLINVNMIDEERYRKNVENKKQDPLNYGYNVYEEMYDEFGDPIDRGILHKYDEEIDSGSTKKKAFVIGQDIQEEIQQKRRLLAIKTKLAGKRLETLADSRIQLASDTFSEAELAKFKKPKRKVKKVRQKLKAEDLLPLENESKVQHFGNRRKRNLEAYDDDNDVKDINNDEENIKFEVEDEDDLQKALAKAMKLKQTESIIRKPIPTEIKAEVKLEPSGDTESASIKDGNIVLNATAEFCRTLGDIPTYGMAGNRDEDSNDMMDFETTEPIDDRKHEEPEVSTGTWNSVNPEDVVRPIDDDNSQDLEEVAILDEEPDVGAGVGNALRLALSKGYLEKEDSNRPSNTKMAHLQAKNYSIEDKSVGDDEKFGRRDRFHSGPIMDFRDKDTFKPNVKLEYIDDNGRILNLKEAFRYLSHKFHGKGPGKNKIEKRLKKMQQDGLMKTMSSTDTPLGTLTMLQQKQRETKAPYVVLSGGKQTATSIGGTNISKYK